MSDSYDAREGFDNAGFAAGEPEHGMASLSASARCATETRRDILDLPRVVRWLPQLGAALWLHRAAHEQTFPRARLLTEGVLLLEHPALVALADCVTVTACSAVTSHGPREWLVFADSHGTLLAKLHLLPDTDYLAWDGMLAGCRIETALPHEQRRWQAHRAFMRGALTCLRANWQARIARFPAVQLPCLHVLGLREAHDVSPLGRHIAGAIASDERADWAGLDE